MIGMPVWMALCFAVPPTADVVSVERWQGPPWVEFGWHLSTDLDPEGLDGLTMAAGQVWARRARALPDLAQTVRVQSNHGSIWLSAGAPASRIPAVMAALTSRLGKTEVSDAESEAALEWVQAIRRQEGLNERTLARRAIRAELFRSDPRARPPSGTLRGLASISAADLSAFFKRNLVQGRLHIRLVGAVPDDFDWSGPRLRSGRAPARRAPPPPPPGDRLVIVDKPGTQRSVVAAGQWPFDARHPPCQAGVERGQLGHGRVFEWLATARDSVEAAAQHLTQRVRDTDGRPRACTTDRRSADFGDPRAALQRWALSAPVKGPPSAAGPSLVVVIVTSLRAGDAERLSQRLRIPNVSVVPYRAEGRAE